MAPFRICPACGRANRAHEFEGQPPEQVIPFNRECPSCGAVHDISDLPLHSGNSAEEVETRFNKTEETP